MSSRNHLPQLHPEAASPGASRFRERLSREIATPTEMEGYQLPAYEGTTRNTAQPESGGGPEARSQIRTSAPPIPPRRRPPPPLPTMDELPIGYTALASAFRPYSSSKQSLSSSHLSAVSHSGNSLSPSSTGQLPSPTTPRSVPDSYALPSTPYSSRSAVSGGRPGTAGSETSLRRQDAVRRPASRETSLTTDFAGMELIDSFDGSSSPDEVSFTDGPMGKARVPWATKDDFKHRPQPQPQSRRRRAPTLETAIRPAYANRSAISLMPTCTKVSK